MIKATKTIWTSEDIAQEYEDLTPDAWSMTKKELPEFKKKFEKFRKREWVSLDELRKGLDELIETAQKNVNKPFNKNNTEEREHYLYWHASLNTLIYVKDMFFAPKSLTSEDKEGGAKDSPNKRSHRRRVMANKQKQIKVSWEDYFFFSPTKKIGR